MKNIHITIVFLLSSFSSSFSQKNTQQDSLLNVLKNTNDSKKKAELYYSLVQKYAYDYQRTKVFADSLLTYAQEIDNRKMKGRALVAIAAYNYTVQKFDEGRRNCEEAISVVSRDEYNILRLAYMNLGNIESEQNNPGLVDKYYQKALDYAVLDNNKIGEALMLINLGTQQYNGGFFKKAIDYYFKAYEILKIHSKSNIQKADVLFRLGSCYCSLSDFQNGLKYSQEALVIFKKLDNKNYIAYTLSTIGSANVGLNNLDEAVKIYTEAHELNKQLNDNTSAGDNCLRLGEIYIMKKDYKRGLVFYNKALEYVKVGNSELLKKTALLGIANVDFEMKKYKEALTIYQNLIKETKDNKEYSQIYNLALLGETKSKLKIDNNELLLSNIDSVLAFKDSQNNKNVALATQEMRTKYDLDKKEQEATLLAKDNELKQVTIHSQRWSMGAMLGIGALLSGLVGVFYYQRQKEKRFNQELAQKNSEIQLLNREMTHRVMNNLQLMSSLMSMQSRRLDNLEAKKAIQESEGRIQAMAVLHRTLHHQQTDNLVVNSLDYLRELCTNLEKSYDSATQELKIQLSVDNILTSADFMMRLGLIINELVTNSVKHGFDRQDKPTINISLKDQAQQIKLEYQDNGSGIPDDVDITQSNSLGVKLIQILSKQLNGEMTVENQNGIHYLFQFKKAA